LLALAAISMGQQPAPGSKKDPAAAKTDAQHKLNEKARRFIENGGQWDSRARFLTRIGMMDMWLTQDGVSYDFYRPTVKDGVSGRTGQVVHMSFAGGANPVTVGAHPLGMETRYITQSTSKVADSYAEVWQKGMYPGVQTRSYFDNDKPRYDLVVAPNANPSQIRLAFDGANSVSVKDGEIELGTNVGVQKHGKLFAYQLVNGKKHQVPARFALAGKNTVRFRVGAYDHSKQLVIDPLIYGTYYGGNGAAAAAVPFDDRTGV